MNYPLASEYIHSIKLAHNNFSELNYLQPIVKSDGTPFFIKGDNSVVFKMHDSNTGKLYAIKCFTIGQENRDTSYKLITEQLKEINSSHIIPFQYFEKEILVNSEECQETRFPVLLMEWVEGVTLNKYINEIIDNQRALEFLTYRLGQLAQWLISQPFAHGNIDLNNIIIKDDDSLVLIDYDGMYVPAMKGQRVREDVSPYFRHPLCEYRNYDENIDDFSLISILLSLKIISQKPSLFRNRADTNHLLFAETDLDDLTKSQLYIEHVQKQLNDKDIRILNGLFLLAYSQTPLKGLSFELSKPLSTSISNEDWEEAKREGKGWFSKDGKRFFGIYNPQSKTEDYKLLQIMGGSVVLDGDETEVICDYALSRVSHYTEIVFPNKLETIGYNVFWSVTQIDRIYFPKSLKTICGNPFEGVVIDEINNLSSEFVVSGSAIFSSMQKKLISYYSKKEEFKIGYPTEEIGERAFASNKYIKHVIINDGVTKIGKGAFANCPSLEVIELPVSLKTIEDGAFMHTGIEPDVPIAQQEEKESYKKYCDIISFTIPRNVDRIGRKALLGIRSIKNESPSFQIVDDALLSKDGNELLYYFGKKANYCIPQGISIVDSCAFMNNQYLEFVSIPDSVVKIEEYAFAQCSKLTKVVFNGKYTQIEHGIFSCCAALKDIHLPKLLDVIPDETFSNCASLTSIAFPKNIKCIGSYAFMDCTSLTNLVFPSNLTVIRESAFWGCASITNLEVPDTVTSISKFSFYGCSKMKKIVLPKHLKIIEEECFHGCRDLEFIHFPDELEEIGPYAFQNCESLVQITLPKSLRHIRYWAFGFCKALEKCYLSNPNTQIDEKAFDFLGNGKFKLYLPKGGEIKKFTNVMPLAIHGYTSSVNLGGFPIFEHQYENIIPYIEDIPLEDILSKNEDIHWWYIDYHFRDQKGGVYTYGKQCFQAIDEKTAKNEKKYKIANGTKFICNQAFVTDFFGYSNKCPFEEIMLPDTISAIGKKAFSRTKIVKLDLPKSLKYIGDFAFEKCFYLKSINIPYNVREIGINPFVDATGIDIVHSDSPSIIVTSNCLINIDKSIVISCFAKRHVTNRIIEVKKDIFGNPYPIHEYEYSICELPVDLRTIGSYAFTNAEIKTIIIPNSVDTIKENAFDGNPYLEKINIPNSVVTIGKNAFARCKQLEVVTLPEHLTKIEDYLFYNCTNLIEIAIPNSVVEIGNNAFSGCKSLKDFLIPQNIMKIGTNPFVNSTIMNISCNSPYFEVEDECLYTKGKKTLIAYIGNSSKLKLPEGLEEISEEAFHGCKTIEEVYCPLTLKKIRRRAFMNCTSLKIINIDNCILSYIENSTFAGCSKLVDVKLPNTIKEVDNYAFSGCSSLKTLFLSSSIVKIDSNAFQNCKSIVTIWIPFGVKKEILPWELRGKGKDMKLEDCNIWMDNMGVAYSMDKKCLIKASNALEKYSILEGTTEICANAFRGCMALKEICIPQSVICIGNEAFNCCGLEEIKLPQSLKQLGNHIFGGISNLNPLKKVTIPPSTEKMDGNPFYGYNIKVYNESNHFKIINDVIYTSNLKKIISYLATGNERYKIADIVKVIGKYAFASSKLKEIIVPDSVEEIGEFAFNGSSLQSISLPQTINVINESTFQHCGLKNIVLPPSITELKSRSFCDCFDLESITIPSSVILIGESAFGACRSLEKVTIQSSNVKLAKSAFRYCDKLREIVVPKGYKERFMSMLPDVKHIIKEER